MPCIRYSNFCRCRALLSSGPKFVQTRPCTTACFTTAHPARGARDSDYIHPTTRLRGLKVPRQSQSIIFKRKFGDLARPAARYNATIYAQSTAPGKAAIAIVRCSGPACLHIYRALCPAAAAPKPRQATLRRLYSPSEPSLILDPGALILYSPSPATVTGEDVLELHLHGGTAIVKAVLLAIASISTSEAPIRAAGPGEFTQRAFYNGRVALTEVEALGDTLAAETESQRRLATRGAGGGNTLQSRYDDWMHQLLQARGELEALIDFSEDQHFDESPAQLAMGVAEKVRVLLAQINASIENAARGEMLRHGIKIALLGAPNVGKSSLLNRAVGREAAIVSNTAGTTRDVVETNVDINGFFCNFGDLAGLRGREDAQAEPIDHVEEEGIRRAKARALIADVVLVVHDVCRLPDGSYKISRSTEVSDTVNSLNKDRQKIIHVINKADLLPATLFGSISGMRQQSMIPDSPVTHLLRSAGFGSDALKTVCFVTCGSPASDSRSDGLQDLLNLVTSQLKELTEAVAIPGLPDPRSGYEVSLGASARQAELLKVCRDDLTSFIKSVDVSTDDVETDVDIVLAAENLRDAARCFAKMTGRGEGGDVEDVLGVVFEKFCVGK